MLALGSSLIVALALLAGEPAGSAARTPTLDVPYLPQSELLCGGAAVAMVLRYRGDSHAGVQEFASLVDPRAAGIADEALVAEVRRRGWTAVQFEGSIDRLRHEIANDRPVIVLLQDRPGRYHFVVVIGVGSDDVIVHDPARRPSRHITIAAFERSWAPTEFWSLVIEKRGRESFSGQSLEKAESFSAGPVEKQPVGKDARPLFPCGRMLDDAIEELREAGLDRADAILGNVAARCPDSAGPIRELAGVRFAQHRWADAARLAERAVARTPDDVYAWEVLASSRYMQGDVAGALSAWNRVGKPRIDNVHITGLARTRYPLVADALALRTNEILTGERWQRADRRLRELPDRASSRMAYRPQADGFATVDVAIVEHRMRPRGALEWLGAIAQTITERELMATVPGPTGQGEVWESSWRWWSGRPRVSASFSAPHVGLLPGVWRVEGSWEVQTYGTGGNRQQTAIREELTRGAVSVSDWLTGNVRYELSASIDSWNHTRRDITIGGSIERRLMRDRVAVSADATASVPLDIDPPYRSAAIGVRFQSSKDAAGTVWLADGGVTAAGAAAPLALWPGAGAGHGRAPLLRGHALLRSDAISGPMFGQRLAYTNIEARRWIDSPLPVRIGLAAFADTARVWRPFGGAVSRPLQVDLGLGWRVKVPGNNRILRIDFGRGVRDGARAISVGWTF